MLSPPCVRGCMSARKSHSWLEVHAFTAERKHTTETLWRWSPACWRMHLSFISLSLAYPFSVLVWKIHILQLPAFCSGYDWLWAFRRDEHNTLFMATLIIAVSGSDRRRNMCLLLLSSVHPLTFLSIGVWSGHNTMPFQEYAKPGFWAALTLQRTFAFELCVAVREHSPFQLKFFIRSSRASHFNTWHSSSVVPVYQTARACLFCAAQVILGVVN